jgi:hypothetical protein
MGLNLMFKLFFIFCERPQSPMEYGSPGFCLAQPDLGKRLVEEAIADSVR